MGAAPSPTAENEDVPFEPELKGVAFLSPAFINYQPSSLLNQSISQPLVSVKVMVIISKRQRRFKWLPGIQKIDFKALYSASKTSQ